MSRPSGPSTGSNLCTTSSLRPVPDHSSPRFEMRTWRTCPGPTHEGLRLVERQEQRGVGGARAFVADDILDGHAKRRAAGVEEDAIAGGHAEFLGGVGVEVHLAAREVREGDLAVAPLDGPEAFHPLRVRGEERHARLGLALFRRLYGDLLDDRRGDTIDEIRPRDRRVDLLYDVLVEVLDPRGGPEAGSEAELRALRRDQLVGLA